jgi:hypothetical protein
VLLDGFGACDARTHAAVDRPNDVGIAGNSQVGLFDCQSTLGLAQQAHGGHHGMASDFLGRNLGALANLQTSSHRARSKEGSEQQGEHVVELERGLWWRKREGQRFSRPTSQPI